MLGAVANFQSWSVSDKPLTAALPLFLKAGRQVWRLRAWTVVQSAVFQWDAAFTFLTPP